MNHHSFGWLTGAALVALSSTGLPPANAAGNGVPTVADAIGGVVSGPQGPEAGVWVIAETKDLPTPLAKIVVTDDKGRYLLPELPQAKYKIWVRGYGLVDSKPVMGEPGKNIDLAATTAPDRKAAAQYYPANYWYAMIHPPAVTEFPGTGPNGNGIAPAMKSQQQWLQNMKECMQCHQLGDPATRELANNTPEGWSARVQMARAPGDPSIGDQGKGYMNNMNSDMTKYGRTAGLKMFADWTQRIAKGELPAEAPARPSGIERNLVLTLWEWGHEGSQFHDEVSTDRRDPTLNGGGPIYGNLINLGKLGIFDPKSGKTTEVDLPGSKAGYNHTVMLDQKGRVWMPDLGPVYQTDTTPGPRPDFCTNAAENKFAKYFPATGRGGTFIRMYDPTTKEVSAIPSCFGGGHIWFGHDAHNTLYFSSNVVGWIDTKVWDETHDPAKAEGWCPMVQDTKEKGVTKAAFGKDGEATIDPDRTHWNQPGQPVDPKKDTLLAVGGYGLGINPVDDSIWFGSYRYPGGITRTERGSNPPETCRSEYYEPPKLADGNYAAFAPHDLGFDSKGVAYVTFTSGQIGRFDRSKCKVLTGPSTASGGHCPEGWTVFDGPGPKFVGFTQGYANPDYFYQSFVDRFNTLGLGKDIAMVPGTNSDSLLALNPNTGKWVTLRVPYPMGFYSRWLDGRIDDSKAGWKGRGLWATYGTIAVWHQEGAEEANPRLVHFQLRPDPLAH